MPIRPIAGTSTLTRLLLADTGTGKPWGENLMKLTNQVPIGNGIVVDNNFAKLFRG